MREASLPGAGTAHGDDIARPLPGRQPARVPPRVSVLLAAVDVLVPVIVAVAVGALTVRSTEGPPVLRHLLGFVVVVSVAAVVARWCVHLLSGSSRHHLVPTATTGLGRALGSVGLGALAVLAAETLFGSSLDPLVRPRQVLAVVVACVVVLPLARVVTVRLWSNRRGGLPGVLVVGTGTIAADIAGRLARSRLVEFVGFVDDDPVAGQQALSGLDDLPLTCERYDVDRIVVAFSPAHPTRLTQVLRHVPEHVGIDIVPRYFDMTGWRAQMGDLDGIAILSVGDLAGPAGLAAKWVFDVVTAALALVILSPVLVGAAIGVKVSSKGPVLFRQVRLGRKRLPFAVVKFRTMDAEGPEDRRQVTAFGAVLRRFGIDELPQLVNVLRRQMSIVGPRPLIPDECEALPLWAEQRFDVRPGLTGLWQVCGQHSLRMEELYRLDAQYVQSWSLRDDLRIIARTPRRLLLGGGDREFFRRGQTRRYRSEPPAVLTVLDQGATNGHAPKLSTTARAEAVAPGERISLEHRR